MSFDTIKSWCKSKLYRQHELAHEAVINFHDDYKDDLLDKAQDIHISDSDFRKSYLAYLYDSIKAVIEEDNKSDELTRGEEDALNLRLHNKGEMR